MRAITNHRYGPPEGLRLEEVDPPVIGDDGILVRVRASSVNALDWHTMRGKPYLVRAQEGLRRPSTTIPGVDIAGVVEAVGATVTSVKPGDEVMAHRGGAWAELVACTERHVVPKPAGLSFEEVAAVPVAAMTALQGLRDKGGVTAGSRVLITGASGGVGTFAVQIARALGGEVTATTRGENVELLQSLGATTVMDYAREDVTRGPARFDVILDIAATSPLGGLARIAAPDGRVVLVGAKEGDWIAPVTRVIVGSLRSRLRGERLLPFLSSGRREDLETLRGMLESGAIRPVIERTYPLEQAAEAMRHVESGRARGKVVITI